MIWFGATTPISITAARRIRTSAHIANLLCVRLIRILADESFADPSLEIRRRDGQVDGAGRLLGAKGQCVGHGAVDDVDAHLVDGAARWVAEEEVLRSDDHGGLGGLWRRDRSEKFGQIRGRLEMLGGTEGKLTVMTVLGRSEVSGT